MPIRLFLCGCLLWIAAFCRAQQTDYYLSLTLTDSTAYKGQIVKEGAAAIEFYGKALRRRFIVPREKILRIDTLGIWHPTTDAFHNIVAPANGFNLNKGDFYYQNFLLTVNSLHYGVSDRFSIGAGVDIVSSVFSDDGFTYFFIPKYTFPLHEQLQAGLSAVWLRLPDYEGFISHQVYFGSVSYGTARDQVSGGLGYTIIESSFDPDPVFTFAGKKQLIGVLSAELECYVGAPLDGFAALLGIQLSGQRIDFSAAIPLGNTDGSFFIGSGAILGLGIKFPHKW